MIEINLETRIAAPIERVFDLMRDVEAHVKSTSGTGEQVVSSSAKLLGLNDTVTFRAHHLGAGIRCRPGSLNLNHPFV